MCSLTLSQQQPRSWLALLLSVTATKVARVFSFIPHKEVPQPLDANLDQRLTRVGLLGLMLGCQHTSMWRDMAQHFVPNSFSFMVLVIRETYGKMVGHILDTGSHDQQPTDQLGLGG
jgi:hypothetical protein